MQSRSLLVVVLENIRSVHNVGAVFRTADGAGFGHIICAGYTPDPSDGRIAKVSLGAEKAISWQRAADAATACADLKKQGFGIIVLETGPQSTDLFAANIPAGPLALVFGHEVMGVSAEVLALADHRLRIPMRGVKESLNVSVAAGIAMYAVTQNHPAR
jgi:tRNA G18 (ribose-2'-O)-methylase SpoU